MKISIFKACPQSSAGAHKFSAGRGLPLLLAAIFLILFSAGNASAQIFDPDGGSGSAWLDMFRGNAPAVGCDNHANPGSCVHIGQGGMGGNYYGIAGWIADPGASSSFAAALRLALGVYSNALLIVASVILLYHLLVMVTETAHQGVVGGKRANQIWAPIRLVIAIGLLVPLSGSLNSAQYITLQVIEWGSNMASRVWWTFLGSAGSGSGSDPTADPPDTGSIAREAAKIGACMALMNAYQKKVGGGSSKDQITQHSHGNAILFGNEKYESLCGSVIIFAGGMGAGAGMGGIMGIIQQMEQYAPKFTPGDQQYTQDPGQAPEMTLSFALGALESVSGGWNNAGGSSGAGWVAAGSWFLALAAGGSNRVSGTDTLPIIMGPKAELIRPESVQQAFYKMAEWIVGKYKSNMSQGPADPDTLGNTVAGRKFVDLMLLFIDQVGVVSGLWSPGAVAFHINLGNSPLAELVDLGHRMIRTALDAIGYAVELGVNEPQHAMYSSQVDASDGSKAFGPKAGLFFATMAIPILSATAMMLFSTGILLGIFMPLLPFTKFVLSVLTWVLSCVESLCCVPLIALAWLTPYGEGFAGQKVEPGYWLILHAFMRPVMTVFGLVGSILLFNIAAYLVTDFYEAIAANVGTFSGGMYVICKLAFGQMYVSILYLCLNAALKAMDTLGRNAITWMGGKSHEEQMGDGQPAVQMAQQAMGQFTQGLATMAYSALQAGQMMAQGMHHEHGGHGGGHGHGKGGHKAPLDPTNNGPIPGMKPQVGASATPATAPASALAYNAASGGGDRYTMASLAFQEATAATNMSARGGAGGGGGGGEGTGGSGELGTRVSALEGGLTGITSNLGPGGLGAAKKSDIPAGMASAGTPGRDGAPGAPGAPAGGGGGPNMFSDIRDMGKAKGHEPGTRGPIV